MTAGSTPALVAPFSISQKLRGAASALSPIRLFHTCRDRLLLAYLAWFYEIWYLPWKEQGREILVRADGGATVFIIGVLALFVIVAIERNAHTLTSAESAEVAEYLRHLSSEASLQNIEEKARLAEVAQEAIAQAAAQQQPHAAAHSAAQQQPQVVAQSAAPQQSQAASQPPVQQAQPAQQAASQVPAQQSQQLVPRSAEHRIVSRQTPSVDNDDDMDVLVTPGARLGYTPIPRPGPPTEACNPRGMPSRGVYTPTGYAWSVEQAPARSQALPGSSSSSALPSSSSRALSGSSSSPAVTRRK